MIEGGESVDGTRGRGTRVEKIVKEQARGKARARAPRRKRFGLFQFDFSSVAVALTTIRRRGTVLFSLPLLLFSLSPSCRSTSHILSSPLSPTDTSLLLLYFAFSLSLVFSLSLIFTLSGPTERTNGLRPDARIEPWSIELCLLFVPVRHSSPAPSPFRHGQSVLTTYSPKGGVTLPRYVRGRERGCV